MTFGCSWGANTTGGSGLKSFQWYYDFAPVGTNSPSWLAGDMGNPGSHWVSVTVTDDTGNASDWFEVEVMWGAWCF